MGYRSDVSITMYQEDFDMMVKRAIEDKNDDALGLIKYASLYQDNTKNAITMFWDCVKWYDRYNDVSFIMSFIRSDDVQYSFIRVGEEVGDIEEECNDNDWVLHGTANVAQYINIDQAGDEVDSQKFVENILKQTTEQNDDNIELISETELFNLINA